MTIRGMVVCALVTMAALATAQEPLIRVAAQSPQSTVLDITISPVQLEPIKAGGRVFDRISVPGTQRGGSGGAPEVPRLPVLAAIPNGCSYTTEVTIVRCETVAVEDAYPHQPTSELGGEPLPFVLDHRAYAADVTQPEVSLTDCGRATWRDLEVLNLQLFPVRVNPVRHVAIVAREMRVAVRDTSQISERCQGAA